MNSIAAFSSETIAIAADASVTFYSPKTLRKYRMESFTDFRIVGLHFTVDVNGPRLHIVDAVGNYVTVDVRSMLTVRSQKLPLTVTESTSKKSVTTRNKLQSADTITQALFYSDEEEDLHIVLVGSHQILDVASSDVRVVRKRGDSHRQLEECIVAVGAHSGHIVIAQRGKRWVSFVDKLGATGILNLQLSIDVESIACHPTSRGVAVGGQRGELHVYQDATDCHHFEDHWHHTALKSLQYAHDGSSLFTGAAEGIMLIWNLQNFTFKKLGVHLGPIVGSIDCVNEGTQLLLQCAESTLVTLDLLQQRVVRSMDGISWSSSGAITGVVVTRWMGQSAVILKGQQNIVRICDPHTQQTLHSIRVATQMETVSNPPSCGVKQIGLLDDGRTAVTFEVYSGSSLPSVLRFWRYDATTKQHVEVQSVYHPHPSDIIALVVDAVHRRVFTMSKSTIKVWQETSATENDATAGNKATSTRWVNTSTTTAPSANVASMTITDDGTVLLVADDSVHAFDVSSIKSGARWNVLVRFTQNETSESLRDVAVNIPQKAVYARATHHVFHWSLTQCSGLPKFHHFVEPIQCADLTNIEHGLILSTTNGKLKKLDAQLNEIATTDYDPLGKGTLEFFATLNDSQLAIVDSTRGFRTIGHPGKDQVQAPTLESSGIGDHLPAQNLESFFRMKSVETTTMANETMLTGLSAKMGQSWLSDVLGAAPYTAPLPSSMLRAYLTSLNEPYSDKKW